MQADKVKAVKINIFLWSVYIIPSNIVFIIIIKGKDMKYKMRRIEAGSEPGKDPSFTKLSWRAKIGGIS